jgi:ribulose-bisphosphate carboxylase large chain
MSSEALHVVYRLRGVGAEAARRAEALALEQSIEMPIEAVTDARVLRDVMARIEAVEPRPDGTSHARLALSAESIGRDAGQLMNMLFGNSSLLDDVVVVEVQVPASLIARFGGPCLGIEGIRRETGVTGRALACTALKPIGSTVSDLARMTRVFCEAGLDVIKDDHGWAADARASFRERVIACQREIDAACRGRSTRTLYAPVLSGSLDDLRDQMIFAEAHGIRMVLVAPMIVGVSNFNSLRREFPSMGFLAHPALAGNQIAPTALLGTLFRLFGADAVIFPNHGGRFSYTREVCHSLAERLRAPLPGLKPALPVPAGGMSVERVPELVGNYGHDAMLLIGSSLLIAREDLAGRSRGFVDAVAAASSEVPA